MKMSTSSPKPRSEIPPISVPEMIQTGYKTRVQYKSVLRPAAYAPPYPARPRGPKVTDVLLSPRAMRLHQRCLRKHNAVVSDRLARLARPPRRYILSRWRDHAHTLPPQAIWRYRNFLDADEPFQPDQAYQFFVNLRRVRGNKTKNKKAKKDLGAMCVDKRYGWARKATVAFARGIQQRLIKPGFFTLENESLRLSDIILAELCCHMRMHIPPRRTRCPKSKFIIEMADKLAVWISEILAESEDRMLMMDFDEDDEVLETLQTELPLLTPKPSTTSQKSKRPSARSAKSSTSKESVASSNLSKSDKSSKADKPSKPDKSSKTGKNEEESPKRSDAAKPNPDAAPPQ